MKRESKNISLSINTKVGNPKGAVMLADKLQKEIESYDDFRNLQSYKKYCCYGKAEKLKLLSLLIMKILNIYLIKARGK